MTDRKSKTSWLAALDPIDSPPLQRALRSLFESAAERVGRHDGDRPVLIVLVSRRMTCLFDMLKAGGFDGFAGAEVISDRAIDSSSVDLRNRSVLLVDDAFILGSTLVDLYDRLVERDDPPRVVSMVACIDEERFNPSLLSHIGVEDGESGPLRCSTKELEQFGLAVAKCLYRAGVPYFSDFPVLRELPIEKSELDSLIRSDSWFAADVTPVADFAGEGRRAYSLVPRDRLARAIRSRLTGAIGSVAELLKVRLYVRETSGEMRLRVVPIGVPGAMTARRLDRELNAIESLLKVESSALEWRSWTLAAQHRLLQMYISTCLLVELWHEIETRVDVPLSQAVLEPSHVEMYFGADDTSKVLSAFDAVVAAYRNTEEDPDWPGLDPPLLPKSGLGERRLVRCDLVTNGVFLTTASALADSLSVFRDSHCPAAPAAGVVATVDRMWAHQALEVFGLIDHQLERPQELALRNYSYERYRKYRDFDGDEIVGPRVIKQGIAVAEISHLLMPESTGSDEWSRAVCSFAIDLGNDIGVVVPSTRSMSDERGPVFRQYRSGETAYLVNRSHAELHARDHTLDELDWFTRAVIEEDFDGNYEAFFNDVDQLGELTFDGGALLQLWDGTITDVDESHFELDVRSRLTDDAASARLERRLLSDAEQQLIEPGTRVEWLIVQRIDKLARVHHDASVRVLDTAT